MDNRLDGQVAVVTGGGGILGRKFCARLADAGAQVAVVDLFGDAAEAVAREIGHGATPFTCNVADPDSVRRCVDAIVDRFGRIDILANNAATKTGDVRAFFTPFEEYRLETWREVMSVNIDGMFLMAQAAGAVMVAGGRGGAIIQTSSIYGLVGPDARIYEGSDYLGGPINTPAVYSASKAAVIGLTRWLATYWARHDIRVNALVPGGVSSGQNGVFAERYAARVPLGRMATADEIVEPFLFLASPASRYVTGQVLAADGGWTAW
ncbi:MAG: SDR family oxidoreductase [Sphingomonas sp.]|uniref:SDR family NAD(P)-dependent oxidoreductase n=1 Tax=Sphingomonas sp. TaxID=28214 RepID=UPI0025F44B49|nr:SDR family oxidoreductase [Sphingomonas sp.]MBX9881062.1 SDR family oxidoreductase [Sphingomonas sp.]